MEISLVDLLENEMSQDINSIDISPQDEEKVDFEKVYNWYIEAEKLIRVLANTLTVPMVQAINQLRYAGHHVLKAQICSNDAVAKQNLIEAYKHCKRAVYDALDFYVYKLNENYRTLLPLLNTVDAEKVENALSEHIRNINSCRIESGRRIEYYSGIHETLIDGLRVIEKLNEIQRKSGVSQLLMQEKEQMLSKIFKLENENELLRHKMVL